MRTIIHHYRDVDVTEEAVCLVLVPQLVKIKSGGLMNELGNSMTTESTIY